MARGIGVALSDRAAIVLMIGARLAVVSLPLMLKRVIDEFSHPVTTVVFPVFLVLAYVLLRYLGDVLNEARDVSSALSRSARWRRLPSERSRIFMLWARAFMRSAKPAWSCETCKKVRTVSVFYSAPHSSPSCR
ncbi:hypothetical protein CBA19CS22_13385 [Caballeronia novacaledonica]|uniref:Uncharacterized protein n=1 Tax=Caballeronia novacaledonica TaxID=1544861 RepID=A0ACB5QQS6_9BURK|nr:hypothetical protein CBA19CS22_13385 [Caballeronia novacaledonica]